MLTEQAGIPSSGHPVVIIGAGPAGLSAAYELSKYQVKALILEAGEMVGGLSRTAEYKNYCFDIGGHRFFTKVSLIEQMWREVLGDDFITRPRLSRIYYRNRFFRYPLEPLDALAKLGPLETARCVLSFLKARLLPEKPEDNFETWTCNRFGRRLFEIFFKSYTEKVWGIPCREIAAEWAAQRIRGLSLTSLVWNAIRPAPRDKQQIIKTLVHQFEYPRRGPGMMWSKTRRIVESRGAKVVFHAPVERIEWEPGRVIALHAGGRRYEGGQFISSMPIRDLIRCLDPAPPAPVAAAAADFHYRDFLTVALICRGENLFPDNWIYVHDGSVKVGRIQNYGNWSPEMVPEPGMSCLGLEYFCFEGDDLWTSPDADLLERGKRELEHLGLVKRENVVDGVVLRVPKAYPVYDATYKRGVEAVREFLKTVPNLQLVGRNGMHRYNNQDHSMLTAILAARNILGGNYDLWQVNVDAEYHEETDQQLNADELQAFEASQPLVPERLEIGA